MDKILVVLVDTMDKTYFARYKNELEKIHQNLLKRLHHYDVIVVGHQDSQITPHKFTHAKTMYEFIEKNHGHNDVVICDAFAGMMSPLDMQLVVNYLKDNQYDICFTEHLPEGLVPSVISNKFVAELVHYMDEKTPITTICRDLINWEFQGIDVGIYLSSSLIVMERIDFLPVNKGAMSYILQESQKPPMSVSELTSNPNFYASFLRTNPQYIAIEITPATNNTHNTKIFSQETMDVSLFRKIITSIDELCPEALISLGVWGEPQNHPMFDKFIELINSLQNRILIESKATFLSEEYAQKILARPNTELMLDLTEFYLNKDYQNLEKIAQFINLIDNKKNVWVKIIRSVQTEELLFDYLKQWKHLGSRAIIIKADSFGDEKSKVVDLAPINRHACYALRRELTILNNGEVLLCRQSERVIGDLRKEFLNTIWINNQHEFEQQLQQNYQNCTQCQKCDDWWVWN